jgi:hypothetical protein
VVPQALKKNWGIRCRANIIRKYGRVSLDQLVRFLVVKLTYSDSNPKFNMSVVFMANYSFSGRRYPRRQRDTLSDRLHKFQDQTDLVFQMCS